MRETFEIHDLSQGLKREPISSKAPVHPPIPQGVQPNVKQPHT